MRQICFVLILLACACQSTRAEPVPAVLAPNDAEALAEITKVMADALNTDVTLSASAFSESSLVTLEHALGSDARGSAATGLLVERPEQFRLLWDRDRCSLKRLSTGEVLTLTQNRCRPEPKKKPASSGLFD